MTLLDVAGCCWLLLSLIASLVVGCCQLLAVCYWLLLLNVIVLGQFLTWDLSVYCGCLFCCGGCVFVAVSFIVL